MASHTNTTPQKRGFITLNVDSVADHIYQRVEDHNKDKKDELKVREQSGPLVGSTSVKILGAPFEKEVQRSIERIVDGRVVRDTNFHRSTSPDDDDREQKERKKKDDIEEKYDTSEL